MSPAPTLAALLDHAATALPGLNGRVGEAAAEALAAGGAAQAWDALLEHWRGAHPEAGPLYWGSRAWTLAVWQPLYLVMIAVHEVGAVPRLAGLGQSVVDGFVGGFSLPAHAPVVAGCEDALIDAAAQEASAACAALYQELAPRQKIHPKMAGRLQADCLLAALLYVAGRQGWPRARVEALAARWLAAMNLAGASGLMPVAVPGGERLALERKVCCQHFRRADGELCSTCPKLDRAERMQRLVEELA